MVAASRKLRDLEQDLVGQFTAEINRKFQEMHDCDEGLPHLVGTALGAQDTELADYMFGANGRYSLIEFKAAENRIFTEKDKKLRIKLFEELRLDSAMLNRAQDVHHVAWGVDLPIIGDAKMGRPNAQRVIKIAQYASKVSSSIKFPLTTKRSYEWNSPEYIADFMEAKTTGSNVKRFKRYLEELYKIAGQDASGALNELQGTVIIYFDEFEGKSETIRTIPFYGFEDLLMHTINYDKSYVAGKRQQMIEKERQHQREIESQLAPKKEHDRGMRP
jgi:hypothetical protein